MDTRTEARLKDNSRAWERRKQPQEGKYSVNPLVMWFARTPEGGIPAASESDATFDVDVGGEPTPFPVLDDGVPVKARTPGAALCILYRPDKSRTLQPVRRATSEGEYEVVKITVYNWSINPIPAKSFIKTEVWGGCHYVDNGECKKDDEDDDTEYVVDGGEWS